LSRWTSRSTPELPATASAMAARVVAVSDRGSASGSCQDSLRMRPGALTATSPCSWPRNTWTTTSGRPPPHPSPVRWYRPTRSKISMSVPVSSRTSRMTAWTGLSPWRMRPPGRPQSTCPWRSWHSRRRPASSEMTAATTDVQRWSLAITASAVTADVRWLMPKSLEPGGECGQGYAPHHDTGSVCNREICSAQPARRDPEPHPERVACRLGADPGVRPVHRARHRRRLRRGRDQDAPPRRSALGRARPRCLGGTVRHHRCADLPRDHVSGRLLRPQPLRELVPALGRAVLGRVQDLARWPGYLGRGGRGRGRCLDRGPPDGYPAVLRG